LKEDKNKVSLNLSNPSNNHKVDLVVAMEMVTVEGMENMVRIFGPSLYMQKTSIRGLLFFYHNHFPKLF
jgi:hypothetical protein